MIIIWFLMIAFIFYCLFKPSEKSSQNKEPVLNYNNEESNYQFTPLLTNNEKKAYYAMKRYANERNLQVCPKIRLADLIEPKPNNNRTIWQKHFNMICSKHIDFALCDQDMNVKVIIELDDRSHERPDRQARDRFVNAVLKNSGYEIIHITSFDSVTVAALNSILGPELQKSEQEPEKNYVRIARTEPTFEEWKKQQQQPS